MQINYVTLKNFGPYEDFEIEFAQGLIGIFGPNGCGKSTLMNGIYAAFTNDFTRFEGVKADIIRDLVRDDKKAQSFIEVEAEHEGTHFTIRRSLRPNKSLLTIEGEQVTKAGDIETRLREDLGVDLRIIDRYVFVQQWGMFDFLSYTQKERADAFKHLSGTEEADTIYEVLGKTISDKRPSNDFIDNSDELVTSLAQLQRQLDELAEQRAEQEGIMLNEKSYASANKIVEKRRKYADANEAWTSENAQKGLHEARIIELKEAQERLEGEIEMQASEVEELKPQAESAKAALKAWETYSKRKRRKETLSRQWQDIEKEPANNLKPKKPKDHAKLAEYRESKSRLEVSKEVAEEVVEAYEEAGEGRCPTCHQVIDEEFVQREQELIETVTPEIEDFDAKIKRIEKYDKAIAAWNKWESSYKARRKALDEELAEYRNLEEPDGNEDELQGIIDEYDNAVARLEELREGDDETEYEDDVAGEDIDDLATCNKLLSEEEGSLKSVERTLAELKQKIADNRVDDKKYDKAKRRLDEHRAAELAIERIDGQVEELDERKAAEQEQLDKVRAVLKRRRKLMKAIKVLEKARDVFHWNNLPRLVAQGNLVNMEQNINSTLDWFGSPFWCESDENLGFQVHFPGRPPHRAEGLSGGQKGVFAIAFRCGVGSLFGADIGMMVFDEPTVGLDEKNLGYFADALTKLASEVRGKRQLFVITHHSDLRSSFDQVLDIGS